MQYRVYSRPPLPRNKYSYVNKSTQIGGAFSAYYGEGSSFNGNVEDLIGELQDFTGATEYEDGVRGLVPAPAKGMQDYYFLKADGTWAYDPAYKWLHEWPSIGKPTGLEIDGDFNVTGTLNTMDLNVQGTAHFWELVIDRVKANGGQVIVSPSLFKVDWIGGTQIYELGFSFCPFTPYQLPQGDDNLNSKLNNQVDFTQWTNVNNGVDILLTNSSGGIQSKKQYGYKDITYFWNTTETNLGEYSGFRAFCNSKKLFWGEGEFTTEKVINGVFWCGQWGQHLTGYFDRDMRDEDGNLLPLVDGLPYDFEKHWKDYYNLIGNLYPGTLSYEGVYASSGATQMLIQQDYVDDLGNEHTQSILVLAMSSWLKCKYQDKSEEWSNAVAKRPDIYYRFFSNGLGKWNGNPASMTSPTFSMSTDKDEFKELPLDAEYGIVDHSTWEEVYWIMPDTEYKNHFVYGANGRPINGTIFNYAYDTTAAPGGAVANIPHLATEDDNVAHRKIQYFAKRIYMRCDDGTRRTQNEVNIGDMLRCKSFNIKPGVYRNVENNDFWTFVVGTGEQPYTDDTGNEYEAFYIDLVYAMKVFERKKVGNEWQNDYRYYPIGTVFKNVDSGGEGNPEDMIVYPLDENSGVELPSYWNQNMTQILNLKKVSKNTLCGLVDVIEEFPTDEEFSQAVDLVLAIRGAITEVNEVTGTELDYSTTNLSTNTIRREQELIAFVNDGANLPSSAGDLSQLVVDGNFSDDDGEYIGTELDDANYLSFAITKGGRDGSDIDAASDDGDTPTDIQTSGDETALPSGLELNTEGRKLKLNETKHNYSGVDYYSQYNFGYGKYSLRVGDEFACLGNLYDDSRMNAIVISSVNPIDPELEAPSIAQYHLVDRFGLSISKFRYTTIAHNGNVFFGSFNIDSGDGAYLQIDEKINFYITDLVTGLETVGIHLDGENSTIKMIGNIELHQHDDGDDDTLSIWDSAERKRVEMLPREIPNRTSQEALLAQTDNMKITTTYTSWIAPKSYIYYEETGSVIGSIFGNKRLAKYGLNLNFDSLFGFGNDIPMFSFTVKNESSLGEFGREANTENGFIDISNINIKCDISDAYLLLNGETIRDLERYLPITEIVGDNGYVSNLVLEVWRKDYMFDPSIGRAARIVYASPTYTTSDGKILNINLPGIVFNDVPLHFSGLKTPEYVLVAQFDVYPFCWQEKLKRSDYRTFQGNAITNGTFTVTFDRRENQSGTSLGSNLSHMTIGTNGMVFNTSNSRYFYAADDGIEMKWDNASITLDDQKGLAICGSFNYPDSEGSSPTANIIFGDGTSSFLLPKISDYGIGRRLVLIGVGEISTRIAYGSETQEKIFYYVPYNNTGSMTAQYVEYLISSTSWNKTTYFQRDALYYVSLGGIELLSTANGWAVVGGSFLNSLPQVT